jgi:PHD/YefM family antitoxin component YafN of YafNO toxin-antitoxin module
MDTVYEQLSKQTNVESMDMVDDTTSYFEEVERVHKSVVITNHQSDDGLEENRQIHQKQWSGLESY